MSRSPEKKDPLRRRLATGAGGHWHFQPLLDCGGQPGQGVQKALGLKEFLVKKAFSDVLLPKAWLISLI